MEKLDRRNDMFGMKKLRLSIFFAIFLILAGFILNYFFLPDFFGYGLTNEDIPYLRSYKSDPRYFDNNFLIKVYKTWIHAGPNWAHQILYVGVVDELFPYNWELTQKLNFVWKVLASLSIFPALWVLTKRKLLATLATFLYAIFPAANGSLTINCIGTEYLGVIFLNLFVVSYYFLIKNQKSIKLLVLSFILLYIAIFVAPMRMIPTLALIGLAEIIIAIFRISKIRTMLFRTIILVVPFCFLLSLVDPGTMQRGNFYDNLFKDLLAGNWQLLITPLAGLGYTLISTDSVSHFSFYGREVLINLSSYFGSLFTRNIIPLGIVFTFIFAFVISQKPKRFILGTLALNIFFLTLIYFFDTHYFYIPKEVVLPYNGGLEFATLPAILGAYIISIALMTGFEWNKTGRKDRVLFLIFVSPLLSLSFIGATWLAIGKNYGYEGPVQRYLTVPAVGISIFISSILFLIFKKIQTSKKTAVFYCLILIILLIYLVRFSYIENQYFKVHRLMGEDFAAQKHIQEVVMNIPTIKKDNLLIYYEPRLVTEEDRYWFTALNYGRMPLWIYLHKYYEKPDRKINVCLDWINGDIKELKRFLKYSNNQAAFNMISTFCHKDSIQELDNVYTFYQDDFFAFTLNGDRVVDITKEVLEKLKTVDNNTNSL